MALLRKDLELVMVRRLGPAMLRAGMSDIVDGENPDIADPITWALLEMEYTAPTSLIDPADADLTQIADADIIRFLSVTEWRLVKNIIGNLDDTDERLGPLGQWNSQFAKQMERYLANLEMRLAKDYGFGLGRIETGTLQVVTAEQN